MIVISISVANLIYNRCLVRKNRVHLVQSGKAIKLNFTLFFKRKEIRIGRSQWKLLSSRILKRKSILVKSYGGSKNKVSTITQTLLWATIIRSGKFMSLVLFFRLKYENRIFFNSKNTKKKYTNQHSLFQIWTILP